MGDSEIEEEDDEEVAVAAGFGGGDAVAALGEAAESGEPDDVDDENFGKGFLAVLLPRPSGAL